MALSVITKQIVTQQNTEECPTMQQQSRSNRSSHITEKKYRSYGEVRHYICPTDSSSQFGPKNRLTKFLSPSTIVLL